MVLRSSALAGIFVVRGRPRRRHAFTRRAFRHAFGGADSHRARRPLSLRVCARNSSHFAPLREGRTGRVVISRYHRVGNYDWMATPVVPYFYAVDRVDQVPGEVAPKDVEALRDQYRRRYLEGTWSRISPTAARPWATGPNWWAPPMTGPSTPLESKPRKIRTTRLSRHSTPVPSKIISSCCFTIARISSGKPSTFISRTRFTPQPQRRRHHDPQETAAKCLVRYGKRHPELHFANFDHSAGCRHGSPRSWQIACAASS